MNFRVLSAMFVGYAVGNMPDEGPIWLGIKAAFTCVLLVLMVRLARRDSA